MMKIYCNVYDKYRKSKNSKISYFLKKHQEFSVVYSKCCHEYKKIFKEEELSEILKYLGLITNIKKHRKTYNDV